MWRPTLHADLAHVVASRVVAPSARRTHLALDELVGTHVARQLDAATLAEIKLVALRAMPWIGHEGRALRLFSQERERGFPT